MYVRFNADSNVNIQCNIKYEIANCANLSKDSWHSMWNVQMWISESTEMMQIFLADVSYKQKCIHFKNDIWNKNICYISYELSL